MLPRCLTHTALRPPHRWGGRGQEEGLLIKLIVFEIASEFKNSSPCHQSQTLSRFPDIRLGNRLPSDRWPCGTSGLERVQSRFLALDLSRLKGAICLDFFFFFFFSILMICFFQNFVLRGMFCIGRRETCVMSQNRFIVFILHFNRKPQLRLASLSQGGPDINTQ